MSWQSFSSSVTTERQSGRDARACGTLNAWKHHAQAGASEHTSRNMNPPCLLTARRGARQRLAWQGLRAAGRV